jgi:hypothetical protein
MLGITRRRLLVGGAVGAGLAALGGGVAAVRLRPAPGARMLSAGELAIVEAIAEVVFPGAPHFPLSGVDAGVAPEVDRILADLFHPLHANGFRALLETLEWGTLASRGAAFTALPVETRADVLATWSDPTVFHRRIAQDAFRLVLGMAYFQHPEILAHLGWRTGCADLGGDVPWGVPSGDDAGRGA